MKNSSKEDLISCIKKSFLQDLTFWEFEFEEFMSLLFEKWASIFKCDKKNCT